MTDYPEIFATHRVCLKARANQTKLLIPFGDIHLGSPQCAVERWNEFVDWSKTKPDALFIGLGDYLDAMSASERKVVGGNLHDSTYEDLEKFYRDRLDKFAKSISHMNLIGLLEGNHHFRFESGITSTQYLCQKLKCKYLGNVAFIKLLLNVHGTADVSCTIFAAHGLQTGGRTVYGGMNQVEKMEPVAEADIYLMGHNHQKGALPFARLHLVENKYGLKVIQRKGFYVRTGAFLRAYVPGERSYAANRLYRPSDLGVCRIELTPRRSNPGAKFDEKRPDCISLDIHVSV